MKIRFEHLTKTFPPRRGSKEGTTAVNDFTFEIPDGKLIGLLGPSGCGKSTALNLISGLEIPTSGRIYFDSDDVTDLPPELRGIGLVFQNYALYPHLTVFENIAFPLGNFKGKDKLTKEEIKNRVEEAAKLVQIGNYLHRRPSELSGGQQQRVAIARALVKMPRVLLMDEPLSNLDARLRLQTREEIRRIQKETGVTTIFVTHDQEEAMSISDQIVLMKTGIVQQIDRPQAVYDNPTNLFVAKFLGTPAINIFHGRIKDHGIYIGEERIYEAPNNEDAEVYVGIRPEGFKLSENGTMKLPVERIETMGRDTSIVSTSPYFEGAWIRAIIPSEEAEKITGNEAKFSLNPRKFYLFDKKTEERILF